MAFLLERVLRLGEHLFSIVYVRQLFKIRSNSSGNFERSPSYCRAILSEGAKFDDSKHFRSVNFATASYGCSIPKLGRKLIETTSNKIHMLTFLKST